jgi:hypothetical protein
VSTPTAEEAAAIVTYLTWCHERDDIGDARPAIVAALDRFWLERAWVAGNGRSA